MSIPKSNGKIVLITGINGYIASVIGQLLLTKGYSLRGTTRRAASVKTLLKGAYAPYKDRIQIFEVPNITKDGAFDEAVKGVYGIFHTASPINFSLTKFEDFVDIAVAGNESLLASALKAGPQLTSVVVTSSTIAVTNPKDELEYTFTEKDFASAALEQAIKNKEAGIASPSGLLYGASKTAAERIIWKFRDTHKPPFSISTINPSVVFGPPVALASDPSQLNETLKPVYDLFSGNAKTVPPNIGSGSFVDVRDVALEHVWAYEHPKESDGQRYIACSGKGNFQAVTDILKHQYNGTAIGEKIIVGNPGEGYVGYDQNTGAVKNVKYSPRTVSIDGSKAEKVMRFKYIPLEQSIADTAKAFEAYLKST